VDFPALTGVRCVGKGAQMNYRHAYHAGNHADVLKHLVLVRVLSYLRSKDKPLAVLDAHAGVGLYDLSGAEAFKTGEWKEGIGRLLERTLIGEAAKLAMPYLDIVRAVNGGGTLRQYPGSPEIMSRLLRSADRLLLNELHPEDFNTVSVRYASDYRVRVLQEDATTAVKAQLPFVEKRGLVLIDPAFEVTDETDRVVRLVEQGLKRMETCCFLIWYPVKTANFAELFCQAIGSISPKPKLKMELIVRQAFDGGGLAGSGLICINPPWTLHDDIQVLLPALASSLGLGNWGRGTVTWLTPPK
jgi:23S rRNA (adenine2030-N6)-methyltransferase